MKSSKLLKIIKEELKDYPIDYLKNKVTDDRYKDPLVKKLAKYNSQTYDEIYSIEINEDTDIKDEVIKKMKADINYYFDLIAKKPLHPYSDDKKDDVYKLDDSYYCKVRIKSIHDKRSLCRYCICQNVGYMGLF